MDQSSNLLCNSNLHNSNNRTMKIEVISLKKVEDNTMIEVSNQITTPPTTSNYQLITTLSLLSQQPCPSQPSAKSKRFYLLTLPSQGSSNSRNSRWICLMRNRVGYMAWSRLSSRMMKWLTHLMIMNSLDMGRCSNNNKDLLIQLGNHLMHYNNLWYLQRLG